MARRSLFLPAVELHLRSLVAAQDDHQAEYEAEVVPAAVVVRLIDADVVFEKGDDEGKRSGKTMPQTQPEYIPDRNDP